MTRDPVIDALGYLLAPDAPEMQADAERDVPAFCSECEDVEVGIRGDVCAECSVERCACGEPTEEDSAWCGDACADRDCKADRRELRAEARDDR